MQETRKKKKEKKCRLWMPCRERLQGIVEITPEQHEAIQPRIILVLFAPRARHTCTEVWETNRRHMHANYRYNEEQKMTELGRSSISDALSNLSCSSALPITLAAWLIWRMSSCRRRKTRIRLPSNWSVSCGNEFRGERERQ